MTKQEAIKYLEAQFDISFTNFDNSIIDSGGAGHSRLICKDCAGEPAQLTDENIGLIAIRHIHNGNMYHPPSDDTEILYSV